MWVTEIENNVGLFVSATLANPSLTTPAKYVSVHKEIVPFVDVFKTFAEVSGKRVECIQVPGEQYNRIYGVFGEEIASQFKLNEVASDWGKPYGKDVVTSKELGIEGQVKSMRESYEENKEKL
jgi:hypothetical protein